MGPGAAAASAPPSGRTISLSLPMVRNESVLGDVLVQVDPAGSIAIDSRSLRDELRVLLNDAGAARLEQAIAGDPFVSPSTLEAAGITLRYDPSRLELQIVRIDNSLRQVETIAPTIPERERVPAAAPAPFSAYLNANLDLEYGDTEGFSEPDLFLFGAARLGGIVLEADGAFTNSFDQGYRFYRRGVRAVYDQPEQYRRFSAGDLRLGSIPLFRTQFIGGVAVEKSRRVFDPFQPITRVGGRQIFLDSRSTVEVIVNGSPHRTFELEPGVYDLADLPLQFGSNDVQIVVRDEAGRQQITSFDYFFDQVDLIAGEDEYLAAVGVIARELSFEPEYSDDPVFLGRYRRALSDRLILGGAAQLAGDRQVVAGEIRFVPNVIPGSFDLQAGASLDGETGFAARLGYRWAEANPATDRRISISLDYQSANFRLVGDRSLTGFRRFAANAAYSQAINVRTTGVAGVTWTSTQGFADEKSVFADILYRVDDRLRVTAGVEYGEGSIYRDGFGVRVSASMLFGGRGRAEASYESRRENGRIQFSRSSDNHVGSFGYSAGLEYSQGDSTASLMSNYVGNRFDARLSVLGRGDGFGNFTGGETARLQIGTSFAYADGMFGIGRPISDSFMLVQPHSSLRGKTVIAGTELNDGRYQAASGPLGAALISRLSSYGPQDVLYDVDELEAGYDIGSGILRVEPPFRSGGGIVVGSNRFVSALGVLHIDGAPGALLSGTITADDDPGFEAQPFFTNSVGRFSIIGLAPGSSYTVRLNEDDRIFRIVVPADNEGLFRMDTVNLTTRSE
ncbi:MAG: hypothetical protein ACXWUP_00915 [Allosphingosinicella sp.]